MASRGLTFCRGCQIFNRRIGICSVHRRLFRGAIAGIIRHDARAKTTEELPSYAAKFAENQTQSRTSVNHDADDTTLGVEVSTNDSDSNRIRSKNSLRWTDSTETSADDGTIINDNQTENLSRGAFNYNRGAFNSPDIAGQEGSQQVEGLPIVDTDLQGKDEDITVLKFLNSTTADNLRALSLVNRRQAVVFQEYLDSHRGFTTMKQVSDLKNVGAATIDKIRSHLSNPPDLTTSSQDLTTSSHDLTTSSHDLTTSSSNSCSHAPERPACVTCVTVVSINNIATLSWLKLEENLNVIDWKYDKLFPNSPLTRQINFPILQREIFNKLLSIPAAEKYIFRRNIARTRNTATEDKISKNLDRMEQIVLTMLNLRHQPGPAYLSNIHQMNSRLVADKFGLYMRGHRVDSTAVVNSILRGEYKGVEHISVPVSLLNWYEHLHDVEQNMVAQPLLLGLAYYGLFR